MRPGSSEHIARQNDVKRRFGYIRIEINDRFNAEIGDKCDEDNDNRLLSESDEDEHHQQEVGHLLQDSSGDPQTLHET